LFGVPKMRSLAFGLPTRFGTRSRGPRAGTRLRIGSLGPGVWAASRSSRLRRDRIRFGQGRRFDRIIADVDQTFSHLPVALFLPWRTALIFPDAMGHFPNALLEIVTICPLTIHSRMVLFARVSRNQDRRHISADANHLDY
jgi:hypothetical protein